MVKKCVLWLLVIACMVMIFSFSGQNSEKSKGLSDDILSDILALFGIEPPIETMEFLKHLIRKAAHFSIYALLGGALTLLVSRGYNKSGKVELWAPVAISAVYAVTDEVHQMFVAGRSAQLCDVLLDTAGAAAGSVTVLCIFAFLARRGKND